MVNLLQTVSSRTLHRGRLTSAPKTPRGWLLASLLVLSLTASACSSIAPAQQREAQLRNAITDRDLDPSEVLVPFQLTDEMISWAQETVPQTGTQDQRTVQLLEALLSYDGLHIAYRSDFTGTAQQVFETRQANCLSFTHFFVAMARALGLPAYFLRVDEIANFRKDGDLVIHTGHVTAATGPITDPQILEFASVGNYDYQQVSALTDLEAVSLFYSNRGAELLRLRRPEEAREALEVSVHLVPELTDGWVNLGVALRRMGDFPGAEKAYQQALEIDVNSSSAYQNLAALHRHLGNEGLVEELLALAAHRDNRNPFTYLQLGDMNLRQGEVEAAERFYRRSLRLNPDLAAAHAALGQLEATSGNTRAALKRLRRAHRLDPEEQRIQALMRQLRRSGVEATRLAIEPASN
ncbi:MAG: tetratricopeptide repeat protein [Acidobacteriota bacterium]